MSNFSIDTRNLLYVLVARLTDTCPCMWFRRGATPARVIETRLPVRDAGLRGRNVGGKDETINASNRM